MAKVLISDKISESAIQIFKNNKIEVDYKPGIAEDELNTIIHEFTHAFFWDKTENQVYKFANAVSRFLYTECGWRKLESKRKTLYRGK